MFKSIVCLLSLFLLILLFATSIFSFEPMFISRFDYTIKGVPFASSSADFDGDGYNDLAVVTQPRDSLMSDSLIILFNDGNGFFLTSYSYEAGPDPSSVLATDIDNDGDNDIIVTNSGTNTITIYSNDGLGSFTLETMYGGSSPFYVYTADLNGVGLDEIIIVSALTDTLTIIFNPTVPFFTFYRIVNIMDTPISVVAFDSDGDGDLDLATTNYSSNNISILKNDGSGNFQPPINYNADVGPYAIVADDFDGDNDIDLAVTNRDSYDISVFLNSGNGAFNPPINYPLDNGSLLYSIISVDLDADGDNDLVLSSYFGLIYTLINNNNGTFIESTTYHTPNPTYKGIGSDLDNDNDKDIVIINDCGVISIFINNGDGTLLGPPSLFDNASANDLTSSDFDLDGDNDIAIREGNVSSQTDDTLKVFINNGDGSFQLGAQYTLASETVDIISSDLDDDGYDDIIITQKYPHELTFFFNNGNNAFVQTNSISLENWPRGIISTDLDGDEVNDLAIAYSNTDSSNVEIFLNVGNGNFMAPSSYRVDGGGYIFSILSSDFNGDGSVDLAFTIKPISSGNSKIIILFSNGSGLFLTTTTIDFYNGNNILYITSSDFDSDGDNDIAVANHDNGDIYILTNNGNGFFQINGIYSLPNINLEIILSTDFDGDGDIDLAIGAGYNSDNITILSNDGNGLFTKHEIQYGTSYGVESILATDFDSDGDNDLAVATGFYRPMNILFNQTGPYSCCVGIRGNVDGSSDDQIDIADIVYFIDYSFSLPQGPEPPCLEEADINADGSIDIADVVYLIDYSFNNPPGLAPVSCL